LKTPIAVITILASSGGLVGAISPPAGAQTGQTDPSLSTVSAVPMTVPADGQTASTITVTLLDSTGSPVVGDTVNVTDSTGNSSCTTASPCSAVTNSNGVAQVKVVDATIETDTFSATDTTENVALDQTASVRFAAASQFDGVSCTSSDFCAMVGYQFQCGSSSPGSFQCPISSTTLTGFWDGTNVSIVPSPNTNATMNELYRVSCTSASSCMAIGSSGSSSLTEYWDGATWSVIPSPSGYLESVSCTSASSCMAVGVTGAQALVASWDGTNWTVLPSPDPIAGESYALYGVSCTSASSCVAVGSFLLQGESGTVASSGTLVESWDGGSWTVMPSPNPGGDDALNSVSCTSLTSCMAVGSEDSGDQTLAETWDGANWTVVPTPNPADQNSLQNVSCAAPNTCTSVGDPGDTALIETWDGTSWSPAPAAPVESAFWDVSCVDITCVSVGVTTPSGNLGGDLFGHETAFIDVGGVASNGSASAGTGGVTVTATSEANGVDVIADSPYSSDPVGDLSDGTNYFDVAIAAVSAVTSVTIKDCNDASASATLQWWNDAWEPIVGDPGPTYIPGNPSCLSVTLDNTTSPTLSQLTGTVIASAIGLAAPKAPTIGQVTGGNASASVGFTAPAQGGGSPILGYTAGCTSPDGGVPGSAAGSASPIDVGGLTNGDLYRCTVTATNAIGTSAPSAASSSFTPTLFSITTSSLPSATPDTPYGPVTLEAAGLGVSASPYTTTLKWAKGTVVSPAAALPRGLKLSSTGVLSGTPNKKLAAGTSSITVKVTEKVTTLNSKGRGVKAPTTVQATIPLTIS
jgi:Invasin, domain 3